ncbi:MAG: hypothetical protein JWQ90_1425 [Hydrocarboniphaga sp.]|uniref:metallophosphoesterase family protein n=1 Tax=Hydrocarboniphaga sp. TaxID=2033016 RepID=UPI002605CE90|nr:metallophosphoesterase [Hydrocarboniphaga sp.]MDB5968975.1 hypothetical protein [Hydrocarboniphaga sp.]
MNIVLLSDTHLSPRGPSLNANFVCAWRWIAAQQPDLVVHLGDVSADGEHDASELAHAAAMLDGLTMPLRLLPGNHDVGDAPTPAAMQAWQTAFGEDCWLIDAGRWRLLGLNAQLLGLGDVQEHRQWRWLDAALGDHQGPLGLLLHKPLLRIGAPSGGRYVDASAAERLQARLRRHDLRFVASGHTHQSLSCVDAGIEHRWVPSTAFVIPDAMQEHIGDKRVGVTSLQLSDSAHRFGIIEPPGLIAHSLLDLESVYPEVAAVKRRLADDGLL